MYPPQDTWPNDRDIEWSRLTSALSRTLASSRRLWMPFGGMNTDDGIILYSIRKKFMYLQKLMDIIVNKNKTEPFICIKDLIENGLSLDRFADDSFRPSRHEITLFLASWCKLTGLEAENYRDWLTNYCVDILSEISSSSASQIRHSTKSSINYIHRSNIPFSCNCENNIFKAPCSSNCPIYDEMKDVYLRNLEAEQKKIEEYQRIKGVHFVFVDILK
jgi:hypothetical protein